MKTRDTDAIIIGGGPAGLSAALSVAERGGQAVIVECSDHLGGDMQGGNGIFAVESEQQREMKSAYTRQEAFQALMRHNHWKSDAKLISEFVNRSADTIRWLEGYGAKFHDVVPYFIGAHQSWHMLQADSPRITEGMAKAYCQIGGQVLYKTRAAALQKEDGRISGVLAENEKGPVTLCARAVVIATGGFGANPEMVNQYAGYTLGKDLTQIVDSFGMAFGAGAKGDGIRMAWAAGAGTDAIIMDTYVSLPAPCSGPGGTRPSLAYYRMPNLMVNIDGERFMDENTMENPALAGNAVRRQRGSCGFMLLDSSVVEQYEKDGPDYRLSNPPPDPDQGKPMDELTLELIRNGYRHLFLAESLEELAAQTGIHVQNLRKTVERYNAMCARGRDTEFYKKPQYMRPIQGPRFYCGRFVVAAYGSFGGILINSYGQVLTPEREVIPGLYANGMDVNAINGDTYTFDFAGSTSSLNFTLGRIIGEHIMTQE